MPETKANIVKKLTMKNLVGNVKAFIPTVEVPVPGKAGVFKEVPDVGETVWIVDVVGIARGIKRGTSDFGDWMALIGDFIAVPLVGPNAAREAVAASEGVEAVEARTAKRFRSGQLFLPDVVLNMIAGSVSDGGAGVEFAFKVGITATDPNAERPSATGYEFTADFLVEAAESDPLMALAAKALDGPAMLPAPDKGGDEPAKK